jgi:hypothetical protein
MASHSSTSTAGVPASSGTSASVPADASAAALAAASHEKAVGEALQRRSLQYMQGINNFLVALEGYEPTVSKILPGFA